MEDNENSNHCPSSPFVEEIPESRNLAATVSSQSNPNIGFRSESHDENPTPDARSQTATETTSDEETSGSITIITTSHSPASPVKNNPKSVATETITETSSTTDREASYFGLLAWMAEIFFCILSLLSLVGMSRISPAGIAKEI
jgi:hypothetical protein